MLAPWADVLYFCDARWYFWHHERPEFKQFAGMRIALEAPEVAQVDRSVRFMQAGEMTGLSEQRHRLNTGSNAGYQAINLAVHLGAAVVALLGFDMRPHGRRTHWHTDHQVPTALNSWDDVMLPKFPSLVEPLRRRGVRVVNCTPESALTCFERKRFADLCQERTT